MDYLLTQAFYKIRFTVRLRSAPTCTDCKLHYFELSFDFEKNKCGDALRGTTASCAFMASDEECDDGNTQDGDGCSSTCTEEQDYDCTHDALTFLSTCTCVSNNVTGFVNVGGKCKSICS